MSCDPDSGTAAGQQRLSAALTMKPLLIAKEEPDCGDHVSDSKSNHYDDGHASSIKSSQHHQQLHHHHHQSNNNSNSNNNNDTNNADIGSDNEVSDHHPLSHHLAASGIKLEAALLELNVGLNLISKPNNNNTVNDDNNNTNSNFNNNATTSNNDNNNNNTSNNNKDGNKAPRKLFECDVCNMKFSNGANMRRHKMRHTGVKPYECRVCQKRFFRKDHLAEHFTTHTKTLPYHCPICNRGFQRQIAMRAHFQNEHVGQHDLVKTCPLCSFRAGTMKSLRVHFFNRHGIDLDNPGSGTPSSLMLALEQSNSAHLLPALAAVAANAATGNVAAFSDSGESARSADNGTPPMHFLTPHVEISMAENNENNAMRLNSNHVNNSNSNSANNIINNNNNNSDQNNPQSIQASSVAATTSSGLDIQAIVRPINHSGSPSSPHSADSNSNIPSSSHSSMLSSAAQNSRHMLFDSSITPSISLIPIKQEPNTNDGYSSDSNSKSNHRSLTSTPMLTEPNQTTPNSSGVSNSTESVTPTSSLASMIKVSPLKSLLREDLKRRITARANNRVARNMSATLTSSTTGGGGSSNSPNSIATPESPSAGTTSNGAITSTGADTDMMLMSSSSKKRNLQCLYCGIEFPDQTLYFLHKGCHSENNPWKCNICGDVCSNVYEFNSHLLSKSHQ